MLKNGENERLLKYNFLSAARPTVACLSLNNNDTLPFRASHQFQLTPKSESPGWTRSSVKTSRRDCGFVAPDAALSPHRWCSCVDCTKVALRGAAEERRCDSSAVSRALAGPEQAECVQRCWGEQRPVAAGCAPVCLTFVFLIFLFIFGACIYLFIFFTYWLMKVDNK